MKALIVPNPILRVVHFQAKAVKSRDGDNPLTRSASALIVVILKHDLGLSDV
jgi:hypothetical protein